MKLWEICYGCLVPGITCDETGKSISFGEPKEEGGSLGILRFDPHHGPEVREGRVFEGSLDLSRDGIFEFPCLYAPKDEGNPCALLKVSTQTLDMSTDDGRSRWYDMTPNPFKNGNGTLKYVAEHPLIIPGTEGKGKVTFRGKFSFWYEEAICLVPGNIVVVRPFGISHNDKVNQIVVKCIEKDGEAVLEQVSFGRFQMEARRTTLKPNASPILGSMMRA